MNDLINNIENSREILSFLVINKKLTDTHIVLSSKELDKLIVQYMRKMNLESKSKYGSIKN